MIHIMKLKGPYFNYIKYKKFSDVVGKEFKVNGYKVIPIYHPSPISPMSYKGNIEIFKKIKI